MEEAQMRNLCKIILRIMAIYIGIRSIFYLQNLILYLGSVAFIKQGTEMYVILSYLFSFGILVAIGVCLWIFADKFASSVVKEDCIPQVSYNYEVLQMIAYTAVGIALLANAIPDLIGDVYKIIYMRILKDTINFKGIDTLQVTVPLIVDFLKIVIGVFLVLGVKRIIRIIKLAREAGICKANIEDEKNM